MLKELLKEQQSIVYHALENACSSGRVSNAYLFTGPYGTPKHEAAILLAQSIFCQESDGLACEECNTCRRVLEGNHADLITLSGAEKAISKKDVDEIQEKFSRTSVESQSNARVYIIENIENASIGAQNSMLKFLEEPGEGVTAILTTDNVSRILPTIVSRCTVLPFVPMTPAGYAQMAEDAGVEAEDIYFISHLVKDPSSIAEFAESREYECAVMMLRQYLGLEEVPADELLIDYEVSYRPKDSDRGTAKKKLMTLLSAFFELLSLYGHDVIRHDGEGPAWYHNAVTGTSLSEEEAAKLIMIAEEQKDRVNRYNDLHLVMSQAYYRLEEFERERKR